MLGISSDREKLLKYESENIRDIDSENEEKGQFVIINSTDTINTTRKLDNNEVKDFTKQIPSKESSYNNENAATNKDIATNSNINSDELSLLAHLIESEAGDEPYDGKLAVASVVMNRAAIDKETLNEVIFKKNQFDGVHTNQFKIEPSEDSKRAASEVLNGKNVVPEAYYFANMKLCDPSFAKVKTFIIRIGDHWFFRKD